jgi:diguanylate cyclase (GGDEF)-like protein
MDERRQEHRQRTLKSGKIVFHNKKSVIDCLIRNLSDSEACLQINNSNGIPERIDLLVDGTRNLRPCRMVWATDTRLGIEFTDVRLEGLSSDLSETSTRTAAGERNYRSDLVRDQLLTLRAALDLVPVGIVLLDANTRAQFINRAFRHMWRLPDEKADRQPPFVALMYHGRDTQAYAVPHDDLDAYVAQRVAQVKSGDPRPRDLRLANGEVIRVQCAVLPSGGRMLCYTYVTDIARNSDELGILRDALNQMQQGIILLDEFLNAQFMNRAVRKLWGVPDEQANRKPPYAELVNDSRITGAYGVPQEQLDKFIEDRIAIVRAGDPNPIDISHRDGRIIRSQCAVLPSGGRMLTYNDVTDLVAKANQFEHLATIDGLTGLCNRRHFDILAEAEWQRFRRYLRPLSLILIDVDHFKEINDRLGHEVGDEALKTVASVCVESKRSTDIIARLGGDEFVILLPETTLKQTRVAAERIQAEMTRRIVHRDAAEGSLTLSFGIAEAAVRMSGVGALMRAADKALYLAKSSGRSCIREHVGDDAVDNRAAG